MEKQRVTELGASLGHQLAWAKRLPQASGTILAARTPIGRSIKIFLFGVGMMLPLGIVIWGLLFWHGSRVTRIGPVLTFAVIRSIPCGAAAPNS